MSEQENCEKLNLDAAGADGAGKAKKSCHGSKWHQGHGQECTEWGWWEDRSLAQKILIGIGFGILGIGLVFLCGLAVMLLWNWLMPDIFGLKRLTYWQAWGLLLLCSILFKGFGSGSNGGRSDRKRRRHLRRFLQEEQEPAAEWHESE